VSTTSNKRQLTSGISAIAVAAALTVATPAWAQETTGTVQGHVDGAAAGTQVVAVDTHTGQRAVGTVDARGNYSILGLRPSDYNVTVAGKTQPATVLVGQTVNVDFVTATATGPSGSSIVIRGRRTTQPVQAQAVTTNITPAQIENLPQNQRNFLSFATLAPGIQLVSPSGAQQFQAGALAAQNANILLDGMSFKNPINHGGMFGQNFGSLGNPFPEIAIQEYQVESQNFGAETGQSASAVLSAITKTGGDHFHGSVFGEWQPKAFISKPHFQTGPKQDYDRKQFGAELGGPIIPGKLTFYIAGEGVIQKLPAANFSVTAPGGVPQNIASQINGSVPQSFKQGLYFGKLTFFATPDDTINLMGYVRRQHNLEDFGGSSTFEHARNVITHQTREQLQWRHSSGSFLNELNLSHDLSTQGTPAVTSGPEYILTNGQNTSSQLVFLGGNAFTQSDTEKSWVIKDDATLHSGDHTFRAGGEVTFYNLSRTQNQHFNGTYFVANPCPPGPNTATCSITNFDITTAAPYAGQANIAPSPTTAGKDTQIGLYVEDEWKPDLHWTVNYGLRWDFESNANNNHYVTPAVIAAALRTDAGWIANGINPEDYISNGHNRHPFWGEFQPRVGLSYDVHGDHDLVLFGGAGRYYDRPLFLEGQIEQFTNSNVDLQIGGPGSAFATACASGSPPAYCHDPAALRTIVATQGYTGGQVWVLPNKVKMPYSDQFDLGVRKQFGAIQTSLTYAHVESHNLFMFGRANFYNNGWYSVLLTPTGCVNGGNTWIDDNPPNGPFPNCAVSGAQLPGFNGKLDRGLNNGRARLDALYVHIEKPFTNNSIWGFTESFTLQRARTNVDQELNSDELYNAPTFGSYGWDYVQGIAKWTSVTTGIWRAPWGITASGTLTLSSGPSFGNVIFFPGNQTPVGACCYGNMGGVFFPHKTFGYKRLDARIAKTFKMPWGHELTVDFEAFNVFNWLNRTYSSWGAGSGTNPTFIENGQVSNDQRQFQVGASYKF
jgi:outer membrane receptor for ferrienterochelin and colicin